MRYRTLAALALIPIAVAGCGSRIDGPSGLDAYKMFPPTVGGGAAREYRIGPGDTLDVTTFQEEDLTLKDVQVDSSGNILLPLVGTIRAEQRTAGDLAAEIAKRLSQRYLRDPQVSVIVKTALSQKVTVEGSVTQAGVFDLRGRTTLLQALAMARGTNRTADLGKVVIFRDINDQRHFAVFNVSDIRKGRMPDPEIIGNDVVVVPFSGVKGAFRDILTAVPAFGVFAVFNN